jgi:two-component system OmpR family sensor kinase
VPTTATLSPSTDRHLRSLRFRVTALITALAAVVVAAFAVLVVRLDDRLRDEQVDAELLRRIDRVTRALSFEDGDLQPGEPDELADLLDDEVALGVRPAFDIFDLLDERDLWDELAEPTDDELEGLTEEVFHELDEDTQDLLLLPHDDRGDGDAQVEALLADPPDQLVDEAYRQYLMDASEEADLDLEPETEVVTGPDPLLPEPDLEAAVGAVADDGVQGVFRVQGPDGTVLARGTALRDGPEVRGALVALADPARSDAAHGRFRTQVLAIAGGLVAGAALAAWFVAGRTLRPAARALGHQERFLADAAHELRTPVAAIRSTAEAPTTGPDDARTRLARVATLAAGASALTDNLLTLARMDAEQLAPAAEAVRLDLLVEAVVDGDPRLVVAADEIVVHGDPALLQRAIGNLVDNAVTHGAATAETPATITVDHTGVTIDDHGPGLPPGEESTVFERFRSRPGSPGHGLGLPLAHWIARAHHGDLTATGRPGGGASFHLQLPTDR